MTTEQSFGQRPPARPQVRAANPNKPGRTADEEKAVKSAGAANKPGRTAEADKADKAAGANNHARRSALEGGDSARILRWTSISSSS